MQKLPAAVEIPEDYDGFYSMGKLRHSHAVREPSSFFEEAPVATKLAILRALDPVLKREIPPAVRNCPVVGTRMASPSHAIPPTG